MFGSGILCSNKSSIDVTNYFQNDGALHLICSNLNSTSRYNSIIRNIQIIPNNIFQNDMSIIQTYSAHIYSTQLALITELSLISIQLSLISIQLALITELSLISIQLSLLSIRTNSVYPIYLSYRYILTTSHIYSYQLSLISLQVNSQLYHLYDDDDEVF